MASAWPQEWFRDILSLLVEEPSGLRMFWNLLVQPQVRKFHQSLESVHFHTWRFKVLARKTGISKEVANVVTDLRRSTACLHQGSDLASPFGVVDGMLIHVRPRFCRSQNFFSLSAMGVEAIGSYY